MGLYLSSNVKRENPFQVELFLSIYKETLLVSAICVICRTTPKYQDSALDLSVSQDILAS